MKLSLIRAWLRQVLLIIGLVSGHWLAPQALGQQPNFTPMMLKEPADWKFERLHMPPDFAPDVKWSGFEEARFAPGMFKTASPNYFTYVLAISVTGNRPVAATDLKDFLDKYYLGLSTGVGKRKGLTPDAAQLGAEVKASEREPNATGKFDAKAPFFDTFNDGRKITLNIEAEVIPMPSRNRMCVLLLISPSAKDAAIWTTLREIGKKVSAAQTEVN